MRTVGDVARLAGVTVRTLHHYDAIGLVHPSGHTAAGYRLYDEADLERLQTVLFYRELGFGLDEIAAVLGDPEFDRGAALREQRTLLQQRADRIERMLAAVDDAIDAHDRGATMSHDAMFQVFGEHQRERHREAQQRWGDTDAWAQTQQRTARYTREDWHAIKAESDAIMQRLADVYRSGAPADSDSAMDAVETHRRQVSERFYDCSHEMQVAVADMYVVDPRFTATYEALEAGLTAWVRDAIYANAARAGG